MKCINRAIVFGCLVVVSGAIFIGYTLGYNSGHADDCADELAQLIPEKPE